MADNRFALVVASSAYEDEALATLPSSAHDALALANLLRDHKVGKFKLDKLVDEPSWVIQEKIEEFFNDRRRDDLLLLYFSGHGIKDEDGKLYFAANNTRRKKLRATAVPATFVHEVMSNSRSRSQVVILDCCYSGAFTNAMTKGDTDMHIKERFEGFGRIVVTASDSMQYAFGGDQADGEQSLSVFTRSLVEGVRSGDADRNGDGHISLDELYEYACERVEAAMPGRQTPRMSSLDKYGDIVIASSPVATRPPPPPKPKPAPKPKTSRKLKPPPKPKPPTKPESRKPPTEPTPPRPSNVQKLAELMKTAGIDGIVIAERKELPKRLAEDEEIMSAATAKVSSYSQHTSGLLVATNRRLLWLHKPLIGSFKELSLPYEELVEITVERSNITGKQLVVTTSSEGVRLQVSPKERATELAAIAKTHLGRAAGQ